jgi:aryl-alcohol dehydrogenase-like predicted oxidoreductase
MQYRPLGRTGVLVSCVVLGTDNFANPTPEDECARIIDAALEAGVNMIDTSNSYAKGEAESIIGRALKSSGRRDQVLLATKVHYPSGPGVNDRGNSRLHIMRACEASLRRLQTDCIDLYQTHRPEMHVALDETLRAFDDLVTQGKVRYIGSTTAPAWHVVESVMTSEIKGYVRLASEQTPYNLLDRRVENELLPACQRHGLAVFTWSPLAMGMLAGRYATADAPPDESRASLRGGISAERISPRGVEAGNRFAALAREHGLDPAQAAIAWVKDQPGVTAPILGPRTLAQLQSALGAVDVTLPDSLRAVCDAITPPGGVTASFFNSAPWMRWRRVESDSR